MIYYVPTFICYFKYGTRGEDFNCKFFTSMYIEPTAKIKISI